MAGRDFLLIAEAVAPLGGGAPAVGAAGLARALAAAGHRTTVLSLASEEAALTIRQNLFIATVTLIEALGGGWEQLLIPTQDEMAKGFSLLPQL